MGLKVPVSFFVVSHGKDRRPPRALRQHVVLAFRYPRWRVLGLVRRLHWQDHQLARVEGALPGLLPPQEDRLLAKPTGQDCAWRHEVPQDLRSDTSDDAKPLKQ